MCQKVGSFGLGIVSTSAGDLDAGDLDLCTTDTVLTAAGHSSSCSVKCDDQNGFQAQNGTYNCSAAGGNASTTLVCARRATCDVRKNSSDEMLVAVAESEGMGSGSAACRIRYYGPGRCPSKYYLKGTADGGVSDGWLLNNPPDGSGCIDPYTTANMAFDIRAAMEVGFCGDCETRSGKSCVQCALVCVLIVLWQNI